MSASLVYYSMPAHQQYAGTSGQHPRIRMTTSLQHAGNSAAASRTLWFTSRGMPRITPAIGTLVYWRHKNLDDGSTLHRYRCACRSPSAYRRHRGACPHFGGCPRTSVTPASIQYGLFPRRHAHNPSAHPELGSMPAHQQWFGSKFDALRSMVTARQRRSATRARTLSACSFIDNMLALLQIPTPAACRLASWLHCYSMPTAAATALWRLRLWHLESALAKRGTLCIYYWQGDI
jgi:hypothetical protein